MRIATLSTCLCSTGTDANVLRNAVKALRVSHEIVGVVVRFDGGNRILAADLRPGHAEEFAGRLVKKSCTARKAPSLVPGSSLTDRAPYTCFAPLRLLLSWRSDGLLSPTTLPSCSAAVHAAFRPSPGSAGHRALFRQSAHQASIAASPLVRWVRAKGREASVPAFVAASARLDVFADARMYRRRCRRSSSGSVVPDREHWLCVARICISQHSCTLVMHASTSPPAGPSSHCRRVILDACT